MNHSIEGQSDSPAPGSMQESEALAMIDQARFEDVRTYERKRRSGWDARAGQPSRPLDIERLWERI